jgi:hypothetical protein
MRDLLGGASNPLHLEAFPEQGLGRICYLSPLSASIFWVVDVGIKKCCRLTA